MKESKFQSDVISLLESHGCYVIKYWNGGVFTKEGVPDLLVNINGYFHGIELKTDTGYESELQAYHLDKINQSQGEGYILRPSKTKKNKYPGYNYKQYTLEQWKELYLK